MALLGADGNTAKEIQSAIANGANIDDIHEHFSYINDFINNNINQDSLRMVNKVYFDEHLNLMDAYKNEIKEYYNGNFELVNFSDNETVAFNINKFVADFTKNEIQNLAEPQMFDNGTAMVFINAILFEKNWASPFKSQSWKTKFYSSQNSTTEVSMMEKEIYSRYSENEKYQFLELPYENNLFSMFLILPRKQFELSKILKDIKVTEILDLITLSNPVNVNVTIPQFSIESNINLQNTLNELNINDAFNSMKANFSNLSIEKVFISKIVHKAVIKVSEKGTKAAAATLGGLQYIAKYESTIKPPKFIADHPFLYLIVDQHKHIHFIGTFYN
uniref:Serpin domain-containing protein n=1 Tax=Panagrolaimus davidi TaxID=227884 RepID=A0A914Q4W0_9BILA